MYFCYIDESGTPHLGAETSHFVLLGLASASKNEPALV
jgi:hypothetical protein